MHLLGISQYEQNVITKASLQIKEKSVLPDYYQLQKLRTAQRRFFTQDAPTTEGFLMSQCDAVVSYGEQEFLLPNHFH